VLDAAPVLAALEAAAKAPRPGRDALARAVVEAVHRAMPQNGWTGVYWLDGDALNLGPFVGPATEHVRIPVGTGVCGTAVAEDRDQVVDDVRKRPNYLACSTRTRSEIVVLIRSKGRVVGQIDVDSDRVAAFPPADHAFLTAVADALGARLASVGARIDVNGSRPNAAPPHPPRVWGIAKWVYGIPVAALCVVASFKAARDFGEWARWFVLAIGALALWTTLRNLRRAIRSSTSGTTERWVDGPGA
jgi:GAF domain-containing protein